MKKEKPASEPTISGKDLRVLLGSEGAPLADKTLSRWFDAGLPCKKDAAGRNPVIKYRDALLFIYKREGVPENVDGSDSAALERYRTAKAIEAERKNKIEEGKLIPAEEVRNQRRAIAHVLRASLEIMVRTRPEMEAELRTAFEAASKQVDVVEVAES